MGTGNDHDHHDRADEAHGGTTAAFEMGVAITNPGVWMAHCHIAEHHESGMMFSFTVDPATVA